MGDVLHEVPGIHLASGKGVRAVDWNMVPGVLLGDAERALRSASGLWVVSYLESLDPAWPLVKQKSSAKSFCQNMEPRGGGKKSGLLDGL